MLKEKLLLGQYYPIASPVHRLNAAGKTLCVLLFTLTLLIADRWLIWLIQVGFCLAGIALGRIPLAGLWRGLRGVTFICLLAVVLNIFFYPGPVVWEWGIFSVSEGAVLHGLALGLRLLLMMVFASLLTCTTSPIQLTDGIENLLRPLEPLHVPAHEIAMTMTIALRFIPTLLEEFERIVLAQRSRGAMLNQGNIVQRTLALMPLLIPLFVAAFRRAESLALAMEARCYRGGQGRTRWKNASWQLWDSIALGIFGLLLLGSIVIRWFL